MMSPEARKPKRHAIFAFPDQAALGRRVARRLGWRFGAVRLRSFPDGESLVRLPGPPHAGRACLLASLDDPNRKLVECILAAETLRARGARTVSLLAPYVGYMRQDRAFRPGEAVSQRIVGALLGRAFDRVYGVNVHLHRVRDLDEVFRVPAFDLDAAPLIAAQLRAREDAVVAGPDEESEPWVRAVAAAAGLPHLVARKRRLGDRRVRIRFPAGVDLRGKAITLVDDIVSTGRTAVEAARILRRSRPRRLDLCAVHALFAPGAEAGLRRSFDRVVTTNSIPHETNGIDLAPLLAGALRREEEAS